MKISEFKNIVGTLKNLSFELPNGKMVPNHYHVTEIGVINKKFMDCGGTLREENILSFQLWFAEDFDHKLQPDRLLKIIELGEANLSFPDLDIEIEYQSDTIGKYSLDFNGANFVLLAKKTNCLALDNCGIPEEKVKVDLSNLVVATGENSCTPGGGCC